jgi:RNA polymerase sigma-70 factor, ECF subfamily
VSPPEDRRDMTPSLVIRLRQGDPEAGGLLQALYRDAMIRFCRGHLGAMDDAEDAAQEVFCKVIQARQVPDDFRVWLYRVARNHCLNLLRARGRRRDRARLPSGSDLAAAGTGTLTRLVEEEDEAVMARSLEALPEPQREALRLRYAEGLSREEIGRVLDVPASVVKSRLYEGLKRLRDGAAARKLTGTQSRS